VTKNWFETPLEIRYVDTDQMGVVHHSVYACYCEIGRTELLQSVGLPYADMEAAGYCLMVGAMDSRFKAPLRYGEVACCRTALTRVNPRLIDFQYEILAGDARNLAFTGSSMHVVTTKQGHVTRLTRDFLAFFQSAMKPPIGSDT